MRKEIAIVCLLALSSGARAMYEAGKSQIDPPPSPGSWHPEEFESSGEMSEDFAAALRAMGARSPESKYARARKREQDRKHKKKKSPVKGSRKKQKNIRNYRMAVLQKELAELLREKY